jgi:hypothetical protein
MRGEKKQIKAAPRMDLKKTFQGARKVGERKLMVTHPGTS